VDQRLVTADGEAPRAARRAGAARPVWGDRAFPWPRASAALNHRRRRGHWPRRCAVPFRSWLRVETLALSRRRSTGHASPEPRDAVVLEDW